jgi:hypothetical protein
MKKVRLRDRIKKYKALFNESYESFEKLNNLERKRFELNDVLFAERLQPTKGFIRPKVTEFVVPNDWGNTDPCKVTIYRNGVEDWLSDYIHNFGTDEDVKTFPCPNFKENQKCTCECKYRLKNNELFDLDNKLIPEAEIEYEEIMEKRKAAWEQIFFRSK